MTADSIFRIYSMSKPITGVAMMQLYEQGKWKLDDPVTQVRARTRRPQSPDLTDGKPVTKDGKPVLADHTRPPTMRELMSHTAGFGYGLVRQRPGQQPPSATQGVLASANLDEMMTKIAGIPLLYDPGTRWSYSVSVDIQGYHRPEAVRPEVRRLPEGQRLHAARHERHLLLRLRSPEAALRRRLFVGQGKDRRWS